MRQVKAPNNPNVEVRLFLAGSIEMGAAEDWQATVVEAFKDVSNVVILNPRRADWDSSWVQSIDNPQFFEQVTWELDAMDRADKIGLYLAPGTKSPISLLELGLHAESSKTVVCCPDGFWRKGNVEIVCQRYGLPFTDNLDDFIKHLQLI